MERSLRRAQNRLLALWGIGFGLVLIIALSKSRFGHLDDVPALWKWIAQRFSSPVTLMLGTLLGSLGASELKQRTVDVRLFVASFVLSLIYLAFVVVALVQATNAPVPDLGSSSVPADYVLGLVMLCLGAYFVKQR